MLQFRQERLARDWTQESIANYIGVTSQAVNLIESGKRYPSYPTLIKLENLFGLNHRELFAIVDNRTSPNKSKQIQLQKPYHL
jgi:transcriptional regulator with XRE-family HTH domain